MRPFLELDKLRWRHPELIEAIVGNWLEM